MQAISADFCSFQRRHYLLSLVPQTLHPNPKPYLGHLYTWISIGFIGVGSNPFPDLGFSFQGRFEHISLVFTTLNQSIAPINPYEFVFSRVPKPT